jgi:endonuclease YncB( thermonuclease family)
MLVLGCALAQAQTAAPKLSGPARIFSTDALIVADNPAAFRLWGVDAPEPGQTCWIEQVEWDCFAAAYDKLEELIKGKPVTCSSRQDTDRTRRGRLYAVCSTSDGVDLAKAMAEAGLALAVTDQSKDYVAAEQAAEKAGVGMWQGAFQEPWEFLKQQRGGGN